MRESRACIFVDLHGEVQYNGAAPARRAGVVFCIVRWAVVEQPYPNFPVERLEGAAKAVK